MNFFYKTIHLSEYKVILPAIAKDSQSVSIESSGEAQETCKRDTNCLAKTIP